MSVYVDKMQACVKNLKWRHNEVCHLIADDELELHLLASQIGLKIEWFQKRPGKLPHYDLVRSKRVLAIEKGAIEITLKDIVKRIQTYREKEKSK